ncbi:NAD(P)/FAD-dependent oxidoreductase [Prevotella koreensis]|uniref:FAD-binding protein n=1 Tax=Prevotella koreensis TaxID=2490854 RepID=A0A3S0PA30_9BACT|nr:FAD-binding protein [Prevotella koreensis]RUL58986.1 FAD-binding protein [Prevotella koreensis]
MKKELLLRLPPREAASLSAIKEACAREMTINVGSISSVRILKRSIDARQRNIFVNLKICIYINEEPETLQYTVVEYRDVSNCQQVIVVGAGPGGLFAALRLIEHGLRPIVVERGKNVRDRKVDLANITKTHKVNPESNYCFGEGGAGAYSDGKLYTRSKKRGSVDKILNVLCQHGASTDILIDAHPHIGTDRLPRVIEAMRNTIINSGGEVHFKTKMTSLIIQGDEVKGINAINLSTNEETEFHGSVILATGHSARDVYQHLYNSGIEIEPKGLAVGVRLEHPSRLIDQIQYHNREGRGEYLPAAEYSFVTQVDGRGVYSFCMCPGGFVIPAATGDRQIVVNGMSPANRGTRWSNSGMVVELRPEDVEGTNTLRMMHYQERLEELCWQQGNMRQTAPAQRMIDFVDKRVSYDLPESSYAPGIISSPIHFWLPDFISNRLREGFRKFGQQSRGFLTNEACIIAVESRTSSPIRILRDHDTMMHIRLHGLFPCGEGAGYAGGIVSAAIDGERCADMLAATIE